MKYEIELKTTLVTTGRLTTELSEDELIGTVQTVIAKDENGMPIKVKGVVRSILSTDDY